VHVVPATIKDVCRAGGRRWCWRRLRQGREREVQDRRHERDLGGSGSGARGARAEDDIDDLEHQLAERLLAEADDALRVSISCLAFDGPAEQLDLTVNSQPALVAVSIAFLAALRERWAQAGIAVPEPAYAAGHSMGQYSAMVAAGVITLADGKVVSEQSREVARA